MTPTPQLQQLIRAARVQQRLQRARQAMRLAAYVVTAAGVLAFFVAGPVVGVMLLPLIPLAGAAAYCRRGQSDGALAQQLDEVLGTRELLASGIACRSLSDDASRFIATQAESIAASVDRRRFVLPRAITRAELAAVLVLMAMLTGTTLIERRAGADERSERAQNRIISRGEDRTGSDGSIDPAAGPVGRSGRETDRVGDDRERVGTRDAPIRRPGSDALGEGQASTANGARPGLPGVSSTPRGETGPVSPGTATSEGLAGDAEARPTSALRGPLDLATLPSPPPWARQQAQAALDANEVDAAARDLVRAYFDLEAPR